MMLVGYCNISEDRFRGMEGEEIGDTSATMVIGIGGSVLGIESE